MQLPRGVFFRPRQACLIAANKWAIIRIEDTDVDTYPHNFKYIITDRRYEGDVARCIKGDWEEFDCIFRLSSKRTVQIEGEAQVFDAVYSFADHNIAPPDAHPEEYGRFQKLPNITVIPNLSTEEQAGQWKVLGCTMGHYHPRSGRHRVQEVYEFQSYGMMALDHENGEIELWVAHEGDKVAVPTECHMTLYNLGDEYNPLITLNIASPDHSPNKDLARSCGPVLLAYYNDLEAVFTLNKTYINNSATNTGVQLSYEVKDVEDRRIRIARGARLDLGRMLYEQLTHNPDVIGRFARLGIHIRQASPEVSLKDFSLDRTSGLRFCRPLVQATEKGTDVYRYFFTEPRRGKPPISGRGLARGHREEPEPAALAPQNEQVRGEDHRCHLVIVVEGGGDWVEKAYRKLFKEKADKGKRLSVFYADDTQWKDERPQWADPSRWVDSGEFDPAKTRLQDWEVYLDKADSNDFAKYQKLRPDAVFVVTPDFTHSLIASDWIRKAPLVFLEKPFDSQVANVDGLLHELGKRPRTENSTEVIGLDHYQFYALPVKDMMPMINKHLGGAIASVEFYLTEDRPIEEKRSRSLQHGLTLDLLPHLIALLAYFGRVDTIDEISIIKAAQYDPPVEGTRELAGQKSIKGKFFSETCSCVRFTFEDHSGNGFRVPCVAVVGKGFSRNVKYLEITGLSGNSIRIDLSDEPKDGPNNIGDNEYFWDSIFFIQGNDPPVFPDAQVKEVADPYRKSKKLRILEGKQPKDRGLFRVRLERERYKKLLKDLLEGTNDTINSTLTRAEGREIVWALDRIWWAIQDLKPWETYTLGQLDPFEPTT
jgi:predicted dehydrogenase